MTAQEAPSVWLHRNPCDWSVVLGEVPLAREREVELAFDRAAQGLRAWQAVPQRERVERLRRLIATIRAETTDWVEQLIRAVGKPRIDAEGELAYGTSLLDAVAAQFESDICNAEPQVRLRPHGIVGLITPWNNPFAIPLGKIIPALIYGNGVVWKPALPAYGLSQLIVRSLDQAGLGEAVALLGGDAMTGGLLLNHPSLAAASFTGSVEVGHAIVRLCQDRHIPVQAELGGNNAAIVLEDVDVGEVAEALAPAMFSFSGQRCTAIRRLIVDRTIAPQFEQAIAGAVAALRAGPPAERRTQIGPVISREKQESLLAAIAAARAEGGRLLAGGGVPCDCPKAGCWVEPTLLACESHSSAVMQGELFGPVAGLVVADDFDQALSLHNGTSHGLLGALFTNDPDREARFLHEAEAGMISINQARPAFAASGPFIGWKASGYGPPEHGRWNREFYARPQAVYRSPGAAR
jgi:acyl-CoA reductase-like NAD-dependent aldehyde dehydrogenase